MTTIDLESVRHIPAAADIRALCEGEGLCVSVYLGSHHAGSGTHPAAGRLRTALNKVESRARTKGVLAPDREALLVPLRELEKDPQFNAGHADGFALFRAPNLLRQFRMPGSEQEQTTLAGRFEILPVLRFLSSRPEFILLTLTQKRVRLLRCGLNGVEEIPFPSLVPADFDEFLALDQPDHTLRNVSHARCGGPLSAGVSFSTGTERERRKGHYHDFCRAIDRAVNTLLGRGIPLVFAGTQPDVTAYRAVNTYSPAVETAVTASPDGGWTDDEVVSRARAIVSTWLPPDFRRALDQYAASSAERSLVEINAIVRAAAKGRVLHLFVAEGSRVAGNYGSIAGRVLPAGGFCGGREDLVNASAVDTLRHGGRVWILPSENPLDEISLAALLRY